MRRLLTLLLVSALMVATYRAGAATGLAPTPPMGWNSWDAYGLTITEAEFKANVSWLHEHLQPLGWQYVVVDEGWYLLHPGARGEAQGFVMDGEGRYIVADNRFPSATRKAGFKPLADWVHARGLKFGLHIVRGIPRAAVEKNLPIAGTAFHAADAANVQDTCRWNSDNYGLQANAAAQAYYDSVIKQYAEWGIDYIKVDCISKPYQKDEIHMMSAAIARSGRPIVLSLSPGPTPIEQRDDLRQHAQLWRISDDMWDTWDAPAGEATFPAGLVTQFDRLAKWAPLAEANRWPDADMLPLGYLGPRPGWGDGRVSRLTADESRTLMTLWVIGRSPLVAGTNLTRMDAATEALYTNAEVIAVDQHSHGNRQVLRDGTLVAWTALSEASGQYVAVFNLGDAMRDVHLTWKELGLPEGNHAVRDLWAKKDLGAAGGIAGQLQPHGAMLYRVQ